jgi:hypothetical protein
MRIHQVQRFAHSENVVCTQREVSAESPAENAYGHRAKRLSDFFNFLRGEGKRMSPPD